MLKKHLAFTIVYTLIAILHVVGLCIESTALIQYTKPLIVVSLALYLTMSTLLKGRFHKRILAGLIFALVGDILLLFVAKNPNYFSYGLAAFMFCHIFYISAFYLDFKSAPQLDKKGAKVAIIVCGIVSTLFFFYLRAHLGVMRVPVLAYTLVISFMVMMAAFRNQRVNSFSFNFVLLGAIIFMLSDAILAYNKFVFQFSYAELLIMVIYSTAQYFIIIGAVERRLIHTT